MVPPIKWGKHQKIPVSSTPIIKVKCGEYYSQLTQLNYLQIKAVFITLTKNITAYCEAFVNAVVLPAPHRPVIDQFRGRVEPAGGDMSAFDNHVRPPCASARET